MSSANDELAFRFFREFSLLEYALKRAGFVEATDQDRALATEWLRKAIVGGQYRFVEADRDFPKRVWFEAHGRVWCGLCVNPTAGDYKGWPIDEDERRAIFD